MSRLENGKPFPNLSFATVGDGTVNLPDDLAGGYGVVLFYRGSWCPYCNAQLASFARAETKLTEAGIHVVAVSVDDKAAAAALVEKRHLPFLVGHSADAGEVAEAVGAYVNPDRGYIESTGFVLAPDGTVVTAVYSSGAIGRLVPEDVLGMVAHLSAS